jgi:signal transduction histidine kinase
MQKSLKVTQKILLLAGVPPLISLLLLGSLALLINNAENQAHRMERYKETIACAESVGKDFYDAINALLLYGVSHSNVADTRYQAIVQRIRMEVDELASQSSDNEMRRLSASRVGAIAEKGLTLLDETRAKLTHATLPASLSGGGGISLPTDLTQVVNELVGSLHDFSQEIKNTEHIAPGDMQAAHSQVWFCLVVGALIGVVSIVLSVVFCRNFTMRLTTLMDNTHRLEKSQQLQPPIGGADEIAQLDKTFHAMAKSLDDANRMKQEFVSMISHDLRTPLSALLGFLALLKKGAYGKLEAVGEDRICMAEESTARLIALVNDLLDLEKLQSGLMPLEHSKLLVDEAVQDAIEVVRELAVTGKVKLQHEDSCGFAWADRDRIVQVLVNLLGNAIKFSPENSVVMIATRESDDWIEVSISDQGRGIPASLQSAIFERFKQVEKTDATRKGGSGVGLSICKAIVEQHGGSIGVNSLEGKGSTFWFRLRKAPA